MSVTRLPALYLPRGGDGQAPGARRQVGGHRILARSTRFL